MHVPPHRTPLALRSIALFEAAKGFLVLAASCGWAAPGEKNKVVLPDMDCSPCHQKGCDGNGRSLCLETIEADKVQTVLEGLLG